MLRLENTRFYKVHYVLYLAILALGKMTPASGDLHEWYETTTVYQLYIRSFKDSNGDGIGDLQGIIEKLDYLKDVGFETIWIQSVLKSPQRDFGYDPSDFIDVEPAFGTLNDFKILLKGIHDRGMKLIVDFIPNHTSDEHEWFKKSENREDPYTDYFVWQNPKGYDNESRPIPPSNWLSLFWGPAWTWHEKRQQFYLRQFSPYQPDLNYWNPKVRAAMEDVLRFWLDLGVDGFRADSIPFMVEDSLFRDNPWRSPEMAGSRNPRTQIWLYNEHLNETKELTFEWRAVLDEYVKKDNKSRIMLLEMYSRPEILPSYMSPTTHHTTNIPQYHWLLMSPSLLHHNASNVDDVLNTYFDTLPPSRMPNWSVGNHDNPRIASRFNPEYADVLWMMMILLPGTSIIYYGEEIQMKNTKLRPDQRYDFRDECRTPMQWDDSLNAGFSTSKKTWLPVNPNYWNNNVKQQLQDPRSHLNTVKRLMHLRKTPVFRNSPLIKCVASEWIFMFIRKLDDDQPYVIVMNLGSESENACLTTCMKNYLPNTLEVHTGTPNSGYNTRDKFRISDSNVSRCSILPPSSLVVLTTTVDPPFNKGTTLSFITSYLILSLLIVFCRWRN